MRDVSTCMTPKALIQSLINALHNAQVTEQSLILSKVCPNLQQSATIGSSIAPTKVVARECLQRSAAKVRIATQ